MISLLRPQLVPFRNSPPHTINITGNITAGSSHTVKVDIVNAQANDNNYFKLSVYIAGEKF